MANTEQVQEMMEKLEQSIKAVTASRASVSWSDTADMERLKEQLDNLRQTASELVAQIEDRQEELQIESDLKQDAPVLSAMKQAENYISELEADKTIFMEDERNLIVNYAYKMDDVISAKTLADRLAYQIENAQQDVGLTVINAQAEIDNLPDPMVGLSEMHDYGYQWSAMLPLSKERALDLFEQDIPVLRLHSDGTESVTMNRTEILQHEGLFGVENSDWQDYKKEHEKIIESEIVPNTYEIYQLKSGEETRDFRFMDMDFLSKHDMKVDKNNYELVYTAPLTEDMSLNSIYEKFNIDHPADFTGHSLSVSDVVVFLQNGEDTCHYVDSMGFQEVPDFLQERATEHLTESPISYYVIDDLATWADNSKVRSPLERFDNLAEAIERFNEYREIVRNYYDDSARTTLGISIGGAEFDLLHVRENQNYLVQDFTQMQAPKGNEQFLQDLHTISEQIGFDKTRLHREMTPDEVKAFVKERFTHQLKNGGLEDISTYMERFDSLYEQGKMEKLMPSAGQRQITEDIPVSEWENLYINIPAPEEVAVAIADRYISIQNYSDGYDYTIYDDEYKELDGGVYDNPDISIYAALNEIITDLRESAEHDHTYLQGEVKADSKVLPVNYERLAERVEIVAQRAIAERAAEEAAKQRVISDFREKTSELFHDIKGQTPEDIEQTVYAYVRAKIEEYEAQATIVDVVVAGSRCRGLEGEGADLDVIVEFAGKEREDDLFNLVHEDGLKIGGIPVDINPITEGKTGTLSTYLPQVESYLTEKAAQIAARAEKEANEPEKIITLTVAECSEFHNLGEFHEGIGSVEEALAIYDSIPPERMSGIRGIGINIHTEGTEEYMDVQMDILSGKLMDLDILDYVPEIKNNPKAVEMIKELSEKAKDIEIIGALPEYRPLAKVEELEEQNYNMIDNVLNNGAGTKKQEQAEERTSVKEKLSQKKAEIEQRASGSDKEKNTEKKTEISPSIE